MAAALAQGIVSGAICWRWDQHWGRHPPHHRSHPPHQGMVHDTDILRQTLEQRWLPEPGHLGEQWIMALAVALGLELAQHSWTLHCLHVLILSNTAAATATLHHVSVDEFVE